MRAESLVGKSFAGGYLIDRIIQPGERSTVYLGRDVLSSSPVAIKVHDRVYYRGAVDLEEKWQNTLRHENIVTLHRFGNHSVKWLVPIPNSESGYETEADFHFQVMQYANSGTLEDALQRSSRLLSVEEVIDTVTQVGRGLHFAHNQGLLHRDIKPANILFHLDRGRRRVLVGDWNSAIKAPEISTGGITRQFVDGTFEYTAPEQNLGYAVSGSDQYALGATTYRLVTGALPFTSVTDAGLVIAHATMSPPSFREKLGDRMDNERERVESVVIKALAKDPQDRYSTVEEYTEALNEAFIHGSNQHDTKVIDVRSATDKLRGVVASSREEKAVIDITERVSERHDLPSDTSKDIQSGSDLKERNKQREREAIKKICERIFDIGVVSDRYGGERINIAISLTQLYPSLGETFLKQYEEKSNLSAAWIAASLAKNKPDVAERIMEKLKDRSEGLEAWLIAPALAHYRPEAVREFLDKYREKTEDDDSNTALYERTVSLALEPTNKLLLESVLQDFRRNLQHQSFIIPYIKACALAVAPYNQEALRAFMELYAISGNYGQVYQIGRDLVQYDPTTVEEYLIKAEISGSKDAASSLAVTLAPYNPAKIEEILNMKLRGPYHEGFGSLAIALAAFNPTLAEDIMNYHAGDFYASWIGVALDPTNNELVENALAGIEEKFLRRLNGEEPHNVVDALLRSREII